MKIKLRSIIVLLIIASAAGVAITFLLLREPENTARSELILESIRNVSRLNISELLQQYVFPHDFINSEDELRYIREKRSQNRALNSTELVQWEAYKLAESVGLYSPGWDNFVVVPIRIRAGIDFDLDSDLQIEIDEESQLLSIHLPATGISEVRIEDVRSDSYPYPPIPLDAEEWRNVSHFVAQQARFNTEESDFLERADVEMREAIRNIFLRSGFHKVQFF